jgi:flagellar basal body-associated protein FliL
MTFSPSKIRAWYEKRGKVAKIFLFVFVILAIAVTAIAWFLFRKQSTSGDIASAAKDALDETAATSVSETIAKDGKIETAIKAETVKREDNKDERAERYEEAKKTHDRIDAADTIDELAGIPTFDDGRR